MLNKPFVVFGNKYQLALLEFDLIKLGMKTSSYSFLIGTNLKNSFLCTYDCNIFDKKIIASNLNPNIYEFKYYLPHDYNKVIEHCKLNLDYLEKKLEVSLNSVEYSSKLNNSTSEILFSGSTTIDITTDDWINNIKKNTMKNTEVYKTFEFKNRLITLCCLNENNTIKLGYSIKLPEDNYNELLGKKIAKGRALSKKNNLLDYFATISISDYKDEKKVKGILYTILLGIEQRIKTDKIEFKGIK